MATTTSSERKRVVENIRSRGAVAMLRLPDPEKVLPVASALARGGMDVIELSATVPGAAELVTKLVDALGPSVTVGAGTLTDAASADGMIRAGARFVISPVLVPEIVELCLERDVAVIPGAFSPSEIAAAHELGADFVKLFPADALGPGFLRSVMAPLPGLRVIPTGGITQGNCGEWLGAGACAVGVGNALLDRAAVEQENFGAVETLARELLQAIENAHGWSGGERRDDTG
jgi:2-dehydro-3-deoxyphosphogluconate aldolase/(4S)-4-hydroxy-2-oxoglutarate aldolase